MVNATGPSTSSTPSPVGSQPPAPVASPPRPMPPTPPTPTTPGTPPPMGGSGVPANTSKRRTRRTFMGVDVKSLGVAGGLVAFLLIGAGAVVTTLRLGRKETTAPTQTHAGACTLRFTVDAPGTGIECTKTAWRDELSNSEGQYQFLQEKSEFEAGETVVFRVELQNTGDLPTQISLSDSFVDGGMDNLTFLDSNCGANAYDSTTNILTCPAQAVDPQATEAAYVTFRATVNNDAPADATITNSAAITNGTLDATCQVTITTPPEQQTYACDTACETDEQCQTANGNYMCDADNGNRCRHQDYPDETDCRPPEGSYFCNSTCTTDAQCQTVNSNYFCDADNGNRCRHQDYPDEMDCRPSSTTPTPTPTPRTVTYSCNSSCTTNAQCETASASYVCDSNNGYKCRHQDYPDEVDCQPPATLPPGCNETCVDDTDCASANHTCYSTGSGSVCRLASNPTNRYCQERPVYIPTEEVEEVVQVINQPQQPTELPVAGSNDILKIVAGATSFIILGLGLLILL